MLFGKDDFRKLRSASHLTSWVLQNTAKTQKRKNASDGSGGRNRGGGGREYPAISHSTGEVRPVLVRQSCSAFRTASFQNFSAVGSFHSFTKTVFLFSLTFFGLICPEHCCTSLRLYRNFYYFLIFVWTTRPQTHRQSLLYIEDGIFVKGFLKFCPIKSPFIERQTTSCTLDFFMIQ